MAPGQLYPSFSSEFIPPVKHSSVLLLRNHHKIGMKNYENNSTKIIKPFIKTKDIDSPVHISHDDDFFEEGNQKKIQSKPFLNNTSTKRKISEPKIDIPSKDSQDSFFSINEKIESNDKNTEEFFKDEPQFNLKITRKATDVLTEWDFDHNDFCICEILEPQEQIEKIGNECAIFVPKGSYEINDILIVYSPFHLIDYTDPPLLITPVIKSQKIA